MILHINRQFFIKDNTAMLKPVIKNILFYLFLKYILFYIFMMFKNNNFYFINPGIRNGADLFYYLWMFLFLPVISMVLFSAPLYFTFKVKNAIYFILFVSIILVAEYFLYTYFASQANLMNGVYNGIISLLLLLLFFSKQISLIFNKE